MPYLRNCCCCFSLKTGGVILGWIGAVSSFLALVVTIIALVNVDVLVKVVMEHDQNGEVDAEAVKAYIQIGLGIYLAMSLVALISSSLLIAGAVRRNRYLLLPWLISGAINLGVGLIISMIQVALTMSNSVGGGFFVLFVMLISYGFAVYIWLAVMSLFQELRLEENNGAGAAALIYKAPPANDGLPAYSGLA